MMITSSREKEFEAKQEGGDSKASSSSKHWSGHKNPRIVRVSRTFGGKDRHSKVCTIRGLRDRRIRLSIPTAIQLYELQDKLGLSQPSKVVDWLLDATKHEIDKLPPLQMPIGDFSQFHLPTLASHKSANAPQSSLSPFFNTNPVHTKDEGTHSFLSSKGGIDINFNVGDYQTMERLKARESDAILRAKCKEVENVSEKMKWMNKINGQEHQGGSLGGYNIAQVSTQNFFPSANHSSFPTCLNNVMPHYNYHMEPPNLSLSQLGSHGFPFQTDHVPHASPSVPLPSSLALPSASQLFFCTSAATPSSVFVQYPAHMTTPSLENELRQINSFQLLSSSSQSHPIPSNPRMSSLHSTI